MVDGFLVAWGCRPHDCGDTKGFIAIEVATGKPYAAACTREHGFTVFGGALAELPEPLRNIGDRKCQFWDGGDD